MAKPTTKAWILCCAAVAWGCGGSTLGDRTGAGSGSGDATDDGTSGPGASETGGADSTGGEESAGPDSTGASTGAVECQGQAPSCVKSDGLACSDLGLPAPCVDGIYECAPGTIDVTLCVCLNNALRPICLESSAGECSDIIVPSVCEGRPGRGGWVCPEGSTPMEDCEAGTSSTG
ncbi:MAG: hypothetical protein AAF721_00640 [Myxococcota bacterium]